MRNRSGDEGKVIRKFCKRGGEKATLFYGVAFFVVNGFGVVFRPKVISFGGKNYFW